MAAHFVVECIDCGNFYPYSPRIPLCPKCQSGWRQARYDYPTLAKTFALQLRERPFHFWRYLDLLPITNAANIVTLGEGGTPLHHAPNLGLMLGLPNLFIKDERQGPTASFKDRQAALTVSALKEAGIHEAVVASTGNVAISYSAYCARAGIKLWAFLTSMVPSAKMQEVAIYGTQVIKVTGTYDHTKQVAADFAKRKGIFIDQGTRSITPVEAMKTIAFELAEQLTPLLGTKLTGTGKLKSSPWRCPDWYIQAVSGGMGPLGVLKGFEELQTLGLSSNVPGIAVVQVEGCAPMTSAWKKGLDQPDVVASPVTNISTLSTGDPGRTYQLLRARLTKPEARGAFETVSDEEAFRATHIVAKMEGISLEPAASVAFAGLFKLVRQGTIRPDDVVVVNASGHTLPIDRDVLGEGWETEVSLPGTSEIEMPREGLLAALNRLDFRLRKVVIVDDDPNSIRLIRRILQARGGFEISEISESPKAMEFIRRQQPDLVVMDLMMPELDGFGLLELLKKDPDLADIPVVVVTAKMLVPEERRRLSGQIQRLLQKGTFFDDDLLSEINKALE
ncbi:MAG: pyridoxal-phosphate dependent enzyme [Anaerolineales bacterium]|nr:pyridoxal-phosphate dependent enzyme [Anaerolineales bacterium]